MSGGQVTKGQMSGRGANDLDPIYIYICVCVCVYLTNNNFVIISN